MIKPSIRVLREATHASKHWIYSKNWGSQQLEKNTA